MECGGFSSRPVYGLKHVPDTRYGHGVLAEEKKSGGEEPGDFCQEEYWRMFAPLYSWVLLEHSP